LWLIDLMVELILTHGGVFIVVHHIKSSVEVGYITISDINFDN
jgi:hypothetical protein